VTARRNSEGVSPDGSRWLQRPGGYAETRSLIGGMHAPRITRSMTSGPYFCARRANGRHKRSSHEVHHPARPVGGHNTVVGRNGDEKPDIHLVRRAGDLPLPTRQRASSSQACSISRILRAACARVAPASRRNRILPSGGHCPVRPRPTYHNEVSVKRSPTTRFRLQPRFLYSEIWCELLTDRFSPGWMQVRSMTHAR